ncbi:hypothetical protein FA13DRAFT_1193805 [Coprinellus micaceus]|uniref:Pantothenate kinase n=1 Tax=Coprinellus micaceus TaxID=71717 RepID=A0A4Y7RC00_COPMI|nr:hypothetical protein FA13DRAFT_1193805 [Coprinellus micaceus]
MTATTPSLPSAKVIHVDTRGAVILSEESPETRDSRGIYLPNHIEPVSHIAVDVGGSLAKVVYFTRSPDPHHPFSSSYPRRRPLQPSLVFRTVLFAAKRRVEGQRSTYPACA